ncbi:hypothetical protein IFM89_029806 [Coptis chinensis]|uniref:RING-type E3 ubiquitin transferase n=1 Tax=Coptis chinensis TaxID=261450 RepID=A0A835HQB7_9MAGN|nr:hypothetical protein IFM89_029806 [Coptis chinensis]
MPKFGVVRDEDEEEEMMQEEFPSSSSRRRNPKLKRRRTMITPADDDDDEEEDEFQEVIHDANHGDDMESRKEESSGVKVTLMDPDVLDCSICMEHLSPPVFQCENGHIACSKCCTKLRNKCPSCSWPIGYNRCLAIEKVIESIKISCAYQSYGCGETVSFVQKHKHEETCIYAPCRCPISDCDFRGSLKQMSIHFSAKHSSSGRRFQYNLPFSVSFGKLESYCVFQGEEDGRLFVLNNQIELIGSAITVTCLGPRSSSRGFSYELISRKGGSSLRMQSYTKCFQERPEESSSLEFLLVPYNFYCPDSGKLKLEICISSFARESE